MAALNAAKSAGASYADVRIGRQRRNFVFTREAQIQNVVDTDSVGCGVRALVDGAWGFGGTRTLTKDGVAAAAREAVAIAKANRMARDQAVALAPAPVVPNATWQSAYKTDPFTVSVEEKADLLLKANAEALKVKGVKYVFSGLFFVKEERNYANSDGTVTQQTLVRSWPLMQITAVAPDFSDFQNRGNVVPPMGRGWEYVLSSDLAGQRPASGARKRCRSSPPSRSRSASTISSCTRRTSGSRSTNPSATRPSSTAPSATKPTTPARASSRRRRRCSASSSTVPSS